MSIRMRITIWTVLFLLEGFAVAFGFVGEISALDPETSAEEIVPLPNLPSKNRPSQGLTGDAAAESLQNIPRGTCSNLKVCNQNGMIAIYSEPDKAQRQFKKVGKTVDIVEEESEDLIGEDVDLSIEGESALKSEGPEDSAGENLDLSIEGESSLRSEGPVTKGLSDKDLISELEEAEPESESEGVEELSKSELSSIELLENSKGEGSTDEAINDIEELSTSDELEGDISEVEEVSSEVEEVSSEVEEVSSESEEVSSESEEVSSESEENIKKSPERKGSPKGLKRAPSEPLESEVPPPYTWSLEEEQESLGEEPEGLNEVESEDLDEGELSGAPGGGLEISSEEEELEDLDQVGLSEAPEEEPESLGKGKKISGEMGRQLITRPEVALERLLSRLNPKEIETLKRLAVALQSEQMEKSRELFNELGKNMQHCVLNNFQAVNKYLDKANLRLMEEGPRKLKLPSSHVV